LAAHRALELRGWGKGNTGKSSGFIGVGLGLGLEIPVKTGIRFGPGEESCSVPKRGSRRRCAMGPAWQREKGWDPAVSSRKEGGEGACAACPKRELGRGALGRDLAVARRGGGNGAGLAAAAAGLGRGGGGKKGCWASGQIQGAVSLFSFFLFSFIQKPFQVPF